MLVVNGDVPLVTADALRALARAHAEAGAAATTATMVLDDPTGYGRVVRAADGSVARVVETKHPGDATPEELALREVNAGVYAFDAAALRGALDRLTHGQRPGRALPPRRPAAAGRRRRARGGPRRRRPHAAARRQRPRRAGPRPRARPGADRRGAPARRRDRRRPRVDDHRGRRARSAPTPSSSRRPTCGARPSRASAASWARSTTVDSATLGDDVRVVHSYLQGPVEAGRA